MDKDEVLRVIGELASLGSESTNNAGLLCSAIYLLSDYALEAKERKKVS